VFEDMLILSGVLGFTLGLATAAYVIVLVDTFTD
jgi:hypothetical protein